MTKTNEKKRAYNRAYHEANRERINARQKARRETNREARRAYYAANRDRILEVNRAYREANPELQRKRVLDHYYKNREEIGARRRERRTGFSKTLFAEMLAKQGHCCGICKTDLRGLESRLIHADHCHDTNLPRGILCSRCNLALGIFGDTIEGIRAVVEYLTNPPAGLA